MTLKVGEMPAVYVEWVDSVSLWAGEWGDLEAARTDHLELYVCVTLGWLVHETDDMIRVATTVGPKDAPERCVNPMEIPKTAIRYMRHMKRIFEPEPGVSVV